MNAISVSVLPTLITPRGAALFDFPLACANPFLCVEQSLIRVPAFHK
jgi:hypothetical protein